MTAQHKQIELEVKRQGKKTMALPCISVEWSREQVICRGERFCLVISLGHMALVTPAEPPLVSNHSK